MTVLNPLQPTAVATTFLMPSGADDSVAMVNALANFGTAPGPVVRLGPGTFLWNTQVPAFARNTPTKIMGAGVGKTFIRLSATAPRAFDLNKIADSDTFKDIEITDLTVDCQSIQTANTSHVVVGSIPNGVVLTKINISNLALRRLRTINVPVPTGTAPFRLNVYLIIQVNVADPACTITDVVLEDCDFTHGGAIGVSIGGTTTDASGNGNLTHDRIELTRVNHDTGFLNTGAAYNSENIQVGSKDTGGTVTIRDCHGYRSGDVGIAVLNGRYCHVEDCETVDARTAGFQPANFNPNMPEDQTHHWKSCHARIVNLNPSATGVPGVGFYVNGAPNQQIGHVIFENCSFHTLQTNSPYQGQALSVTNPIVTLEILGEFHMNATAVNHSLGANYSGGLVSFSPSGSNLSTFQVRGALRSNVSGTITLNAFTYTWQEVVIVGTTSTSYVVDVDAHYFNNALAGIAAASFNAMVLGPSTVVSAPLPLFRGSYRVVGESYSAADTTPNGIIVQPYAGTAQITIQPLFVCRNCDFAVLPSGAVTREVQANGTVTGGAQANAAGAYPLVTYPGLILANNNDNFGKGATSFWTTVNTGLSTGVNVQNVSGWPQMVWFDTNSLTALSFNHRTDVNAAKVFLAAGNGPYYLQPGDNLTNATAAANITYHVIPYRNL